MPSEGDRADDSAIWIHPSDPARSTIVGTDKERGLAVYDLSGEEIQFLADGGMNNVDLRDGFPLGADDVTLVAASHRRGEYVALYRVDAGTRELVEIEGGRVELGISAYGLCLYRSAESGAVFVFVNSERGEVEQWELTSRARGVEAELVRSFDVGGQTEGCVADDELGRLYVGEEEAGIWRYGAEPAAGETRTQVDSTDPDGHLTADVEGLTIVPGPDGGGYLIASSQGDDSFAVYRRDGENEFVSRFRVGEGNGIDDVEETDGIDATPTALGPDFPHGVFVAQDGTNGDENQNFKLVPLPAPE